MYIKFLLFLLIDYCGSGRFHCGSGQCIDERQRCDGSRDCNNGADEADCYGKKTV